MINLKIVKGYSILALIIAINFAKVDCKVGDSCKSMKDCNVKIGEYCIKGQCQVLCNGGYDCPSDYSCDLENQICVKK